MNKNTLDAPRSLGRFDKLIAKHRGALAVLATSLSLNSVACGGGSNGNENPGGSGGVAGAAGEGGSGGSSAEGGTGGIGGSAGDAGPDVDAGGSAGSAGEGGTDPCEGFAAPDGLAEVTLAHGETGKAIVELAQGDANTPFNGGGIRNIHRDTLENSEQIGDVRYIVRGLFIYDEPTGFNTVQDRSGYVVEAVPVDNQMVDDGQGIGNCVPNTLKMKANIEAGKKPFVVSPANIYGTAALRVGSNYTFLEQGQMSKLTSTGAEAEADRLGDYVFFNEDPKVNIQMVSSNVEVSQDGYMTINLQGGVTDEGEGNALVYENMTVEVNIEEVSHSFSQVDPVNNPHLWRSDQPFADGQHKLEVTVNGLNHSLHGGDQATFNLTVEVTGQDLCANVTCEDNNDCTADSCDPADGLCDFVPEVGKSCDDGVQNTINDECNAAGVCVGETVACVSDPQCDDNNACNGVETCGANNECENGTPPVIDDGLTCNGQESCDPPTGNIIPGTDVNCNNGVCTEPAGACACDTGYAAPDCVGCDTAGGYIPSTVTPGDCIDDPCDPNPFPNASCSVVNDQAVMGACDSGYVDSNAVPGTCVDDPCKPEACNDNGTCTQSSTDTASCACDSGYAGGDCGSCDTTGGYIPSTVNAGECIDDPCEPNPFPNASCSVVNDQAVMGACDSGYVDSNAVPGTCVDDPCEPEACNDHGTCTQSSTDTASCACDAGFAGASCNQCDTANGEYENNYPICSPDVTPPSNPVITTHAGGNFGTSQATFELAGTTDSDTHEMWYNIDGSSYSKISGYPAFSSSWSRNFTISNVWEQHEYCFKAEDQANNRSGADCITVQRVP